MHELIFEYLKIEDTGKIRYFIEINKQKIVNLGTRGWLPQFKEEIGRLVEHFERLRNADVKDISYSDFEPRVFSTAIAGSGATPFRGYCNVELIGKLLDKGRLIKHLELGRRYVTIKTRTRILMKKSRK